MFVDVCSSFHYQFSKFNKKFYIQFKSRVFWGGNQFWTPPRRRPTDPPVWSAELQGRTEGTPASPHKNI